MALGSIRPLGMALGMALGLALGRTKVVGMALGRTRVLTERGLGMALAKSWVLIGRSEAR